MKAAIALGLALALAGSALAARHYLQREWLAQRDTVRMCQYTNGAVLNVGYRQCPPYIDD